MYAVANSDGKAGVVIFTDSAYAIAIKKSDAMAAAIKKCAGCEVLSVEDTPLADVANRMPQLTTSLIQRYGDKWTYSLGINDLYYDFMGPSLGAAGKAPEGPPQNISGGDGSESAYQRIRTGQYQVATVPEPLTMQGWQLVDELNRAFAGEQPSGYFAAGAPGREGQRRVRWRRQEHLRSRQRLPRRLPEDLEGEVATGPARGGDLP